MQFLRSAVAQFKSMMKFPVSADVIKGLGQQVALLTHILSLEVHLLHHLLAHLLSHAVHC